MTRWVVMLTRALPAIFIANTIAAAPVHAGCVSDCRDNYESEVESCKLLYDDPDDSDSLSVCIDNAKSEYEDCVDECHS